MKRHNISKNDILRQIYENLGIPNAYSSKILEHILKLIIDGLNEKNIVKISGFGTFKLKSKKSRVGRNPMNGKLYEIKSRKVVSFYPSLNVKNKINGKK